MISIPNDYTPDRAYAVYSRDEYTRWMVQKRLLNSGLEPFYYIDVVAIRGTYILFTHGYEDQEIHRLAFAPIDTDFRWWWKSMLSTIRFFYEESKFYGPQ
ncbi:hypothetical protein LCGC14_1171600 [marine sediment metagenome]|uniref:Uncharacterized protein n=1 Tax=marine sediment metagenome TaxID=412755 RepID=A0A0F9MCM4_9ZZZZ